MWHGNHGLKDRGLPDNINVVEQVPAQMRERMHTSTHARTHARTHACKLKHQVFVDGPGSFRVTVTGHDVPVGPQVSATRAHNACVRMHASV